MSTKQKFRFARLLKTLFIVGLGACLLWGIWLIYTSVRDLPTIDASSLQPPAPTTIYDADGNVVTQLGNAKVIPVQISQVPAVVKNSFLAAEDIRFYQNQGIDFRSIARSAWYDLTTLSLNQGASTITQQLAKNAFLTPDRTLKRKIQEVMLGFELAHNYSKDEILSMYLNKIYMGNGAYGIGAAAKTYFNKDLNQLTLSEAALLAGLPQAPSGYSPVSHPDAAVKRRNEILGKMLKYNLITQEQYQQAMAESLQVSNASSVSENKYPYYMDYVTSSLVKRFGEDTVYRGGLKVYTNLDPKVQVAVENAFSNESNFPASTRDASGILQPEGAAVFLNPKSGAIVAIVGGREHTGKQVLDRALQSYRQPGSSIKPFVDYGPAIEYNGMTPDSIVDDSPVTIGNYSPKNDNNSYAGPVTLRTALALSINVVAVKLLDQVGVPQAVKFAKNVGITSLSPAKEGLSMALGGLYKGVTPLEMAGAYGALANRGAYIKPDVINKVVGQDGSLLYQQPSHMQQAMQPYTAAALTSMLESVVTEGTGISAQLPGRPVAGKTGTAEQGRDLWFCGFTPQLTGVVWIGYDNPQSSNQYGGNYPAHIWNQVMTVAMAGKPVVRFQDLYPDIYPKFGYQGSSSDTQSNTNSGADNGTSTNTTDNTSGNTSGGNAADQSQSGNNQQNGTTTGNNSVPSNTTPADSGQQNTGQGVQSGSDSQQPTNNGGTGQTGGHNHQNQGSNSWLPGM